MMLMVAAFCTMLPQASGAAVVSFNPALELSQVYTSNALFTSDETATSDTYTGFALVLPVKREAPKNTAEFTYRPSYQAYDSLDSLSNLPPSLLFRLDSTPTEALSTNLSTSYYRGQDQGLPNSDTGPDLILTPRNTREQGRIDLGFSHRFSGKWNWGANAYYEALSYTTIDDIEQDPNAYIPENRTAIGLVGRFGRAVSARTNVGLAVRFNQFDLDISGTEQVQRLELTLLHKPSRRNQLDVRLGAFRGEFDRNVPVEPGQSDSRSGFSGNFLFERIFSAFNFRIFALHEPTSGYNFIGTSTNTVAGLSLSWALSKRVSTGATARFSRADSTFEDDVTVENIGLGGTLDYRPFRTLSFRFSAAASDQTSGGQLEAAGNASIAVFQGSLDIVWTPLANKKIAAGFLGTGN